MRIVARFRFRKRPLLVIDDGDTDARPGSARRRVDEPEVDRRFRFRMRAGVFFLASICGAGFVAAVIGDGGFLDLMRVNREIAELKTDIEARNEAVADLELAIWQLEHATMARERVAREQLGLMQPDEIGFLLPRQDEIDWSASPRDEKAAN